MAPRGRPRKDGQPIRLKKQLKTPRTTVLRKIANSKKLPSPATPAEGEIEVATPLGTPVDGEDDRFANDTALQADVSRNEETEDEIAPADVTMDDDDRSVLPDVTPASGGAAAEPELEASDSPVVRNAAPPPRTALPPIQNRGTGASGSGRPGRGARAGAGAGTGPGSSIGYTSSHVDLDAISYRQLAEDVYAYVADLDFCDEQLAMPDLTPQEARTLQLRRLDLSHQIRYSRHRQESLQARRILSGGRPFDVRPELPMRAVPPTAPFAGGGGGGGGGGSPVRTTWVAMTGTEGSTRRKTTAGGAAKGKLKRSYAASSSVEDRNGTAASASASASASAAPGPNKRPRAVSEVSVPDTISMHSGYSNNGVPAVGVGIGGDIHHIDYRSEGEENADDSRMSNGYGTENGANGHGHGRGGVGYGNGHGSGMHSGVDDAQTLQRLGFWKCRLCVSEKYMSAGPERQPSAPSKWPLKDMGKLMSHYFDMHTEHDPEERCAELGAALDHNRGPFEYWLRKSRGQRIPDRIVIDEAISLLLAGRVPMLLRNLCRAAAAFPRSDSEARPEA